jgi:hypothetical protein
VKGKSQKPLNARARARENPLERCRTREKDRTPEQKQPFVKFAFRKTGILHHSHTENTSGVKIAFKKRRKRRGTIQEKP